jgi:hypothetical protein
MESRERLASRPSGYTSLLKDTLKRHGNLDWKLALNRSASYDKAFF